MQEILSLPPPFSGAMGGTEILHDKQNQKIQFLRHLEQIYERIRIIINRFKNHKNTSKEGIESSIQNLDQK